jgi:hypothetical protein
MAMIHKLLEAILAYIEDLEHRCKLTTIAELKEKIKQDITVKEKEVRPTFAVHMRHSAEWCPLLNNEVMKKLREISSKIEEIAEKYEVKVLCSYHSVTEHLMFCVVEAPSMSVVENFFKERDLASWNTVEILPVRVEDAKSYGDTVFFIPGK